jgi:hypothetical protein
MIKPLLGALVAMLVVSSGALAVCPYDVNCINNPYGGRSLDTNGNQLPPPYPYGQTGAAFGNNPLPLNPNFALGQRPLTQPGSRPDRLTTSPFPPLPNANPYGRDRAPNADDDQ